MKRLCFDLASNARFPPLDPWKRDPDDARASLANIYPTNEGLRFDAATVINFDSNESVTFLDPGGLAACLIEADEIVS